jgi:hypothetical protein
MDKPIASALKTVFLVHAVVGLVFGLGYLFIPSTMAGWFNFTGGGDYSYQRLVGAAILGFATSSIFAYMAQGWREVRIVVLGELVFTLLAALLSLWLVLDGTWPAAGWLNVAIMALFFLAFGYFYWREESMPVPKPA